MYSTIENLLSVPVYGPFLKLERYHDGNFFQEYTAV